MSGHPEGESIRLNYARRMVGGDWLQGDGRE